jgi:hypothetical protein
MTSHTQTVVLGKKALRWPLEGHPLAGYRWLVYQSHRLAGVRPRAIRPMIRYFFASAAFLVSSLAFAEEERYPRTPSDIHDVQTILFELGFTGGADYPDGKLGPKTTEAIRSSRSSTISHRRDTSQRTS